MTGAERQWWRAINLDRSYRDPYFALIEIYEQEGQLAQAMDTLNRLQTVDPGISSLTARRAELYLAGNQVESALRSAQAGVAEAPKLPAARAVQGMALEACGDPGEGIKELQAAHRMAPGEDRFELQLVQLLGRNGKSGEALQIARDEVAHSFYRANQARYLLGWLLLDESPQTPENVSQAARVLKQAIGLDPDHAPSNGEYGIALVRTKNYAEARPFLVKAWNGGYQEPQVALALAQLARALHQPDAESWGHRAQEIQAFRSALRKSRSAWLRAPEDRANNLQLARLELSNGDTRDAAILSRRVLAKEPSNSQALAIYRETGAGRSQPSNTAP